MRDGMTATTKEAVETNKAIQSAFNQSATAVDNLGNSFDGDTEKLIKLRDQAKTLGSELGKAMSGNNVGNDLQKKIAGFSDLFKDLQKAAKVDLQLDAGKLAAIEKQLKASKNDFQALQVAVKAVKGELANMDQGSEAFKQLSQNVSVAETFLDELNASLKEGGKDLNNFTASLLDTSLKFDEVYQDLQPLTSRLGELEDRLYELALAGQQNTTEFKELQAEAIRFRQTIQQVDASVDTLAKSSAKIDIAVEAVSGLVGAFTAAQGAIALFGSENEEMNRVLEKVMGAMAVLQGIQAVANTLNKDSALSVLLMSRAQQQATVSTVALTAATGAEAAATEVATVATNTWTAALLANPIVAITVAVVAITAAIIAFAMATDDAEEKLEDLNRALERNRTNLDLDIAAFRRRTDLMVAMAKAAGATESQITTIEGKALADQINQRQEALNELRRLYDERLKAGVDDAEAFKNLSDTIFKEEQNLQDLNNQLQIQRLNRDKQVADETKALREKALEDQRKANEKERAEREQLSRFIRAAEDAQLATMEEGTEKLKAAAQLRTARQLEELNKEVALTKDAAAARARATAQIENQLAKELADIDLDAAKKRAELRATGLQQLAELSQDGIKKDLALLKLEYEQRKKQIEENYKNEEELRIQLLQALETNFNDRRKKVLDDANMAALEEQERAAKAEVELLYAFAGESEKVEEAKQQDLLRVQLKYAQLRLDALRASGAAEGGAEVAEAKATIAKLTAALDKAVKEAGNKTFNIFDILGLGDLTTEQKAAIEKAASSIMQSVGELTNFIVSQYDEQIKKQEEVIQDFDDDIEELEDTLEKEKELRDKGAANNVERIEKELAARKAAREKELADLAEMQKKKKTLQQAELLIDSIAQASNLITAASTIYKVLAALGPFGVGLATATVGLMIGSFLAAKVSAFNAVGDTQSFGEGGEVDGPSHAQGGRRYRAVDGSGNLVEIEGGEYVVRKSQTRKHKPLLEAINRGYLDGMTRDELADFLASVGGVHLRNEAAEQALHMHSVRESAISSSTYGPKRQDNAVLEGIGENVAYLAEREKNRREHWEDAKYWYTKVGNTTYRTEKS